MIGRTVAGLGAFLIAGGSWPAGTTPTPPATA